MSAELMAQEVLGLMLSGAMGETRLKLSGDQPALAIEPPIPRLG
jgi:hypothetical protein